MTGSDFELLLQLIGPSIKSKTLIWERKSQ